MSSATTSNLLIVIYYTILLSGIERLNQKINEDIDIVTNENIEQKGELNLII